MRQTFFSRLDCIVEEGLERRPPFLTSRGFMMPASSAFAASANHFGTAELTERFSRNARSAAHSVEFIRVRHV